MLQHPKDDWALYLLGAFFALFLKWHYYVAHGEGAGKKRWDSTKEWFDVRSREDAVSWATTIGVVWTLGAVYIDRVVFLWEWLAIVPVVQPIAFLFGTLNEYICPNVVKWILSKLPAPPA